MKKLNINLPENIKPFFRSCGRTIKKFIIDYGKILFFLVIAIGFLAQPVFTGGSVYFNFVVLAGVFFMSIIVNFFTRKESFARRGSLLAVAFAAASLMMTVYARPIGDNEYNFINKLPQELFPWLSWNPSFETVYKDCEGRGDTYRFSITTTEGGFQVQHECIAYIMDAKTWQMYDLDTKKLRTFIKNDAEKRITNLLKQSCTQGVLSAEKRFWYRNGVCTGAEIIPREVVVRH